MKAANGHLAKAVNFDCPNYWQYFGTRLANLAEIPEGATLLDVGTGSGSVLIPAAEKIGGYGKGIGVDINMCGLELALPKTKKRSLRNTVLAQMDAGSLGFMDGLFDFVLSGFVGWSDCFDFETLVFIGSDTRLAEMSRVLKVGGRIGISSWARQDDLDWLGYQFERYLPAYSAEQGIGSSWAAYSKENAPGFEMILQDWNFQDIEITAEKTVVVSADEEAWWQQICEAGWWVQIDRVAVTDKGKFLKFKEKVFENLQEHKHNDGIHFSKTVLFAFGRKSL